MTIGIERLKLHGFHPAEANRVAAALEAELARLAASAGPHFAAASEPWRAAAGYQPSRIPEQAGRSAARALWSAITAGEG